MAQMSAGSPGIQCLHAAAAYLVSNCHSCSLALSHDLALLPRRCGNDEGVGGVVDKLRISFIHDRKPQRPTQALRTRPTAQVRS